MKKSLISGFALSLISSAALAEGMGLPEVVFPEVEVTVGAERELEAEINSVYSSVAIGSLRVGTTFADTAADQGAFSVSKYEFDVEQPLGPNVVLYVENDFNNEFKHTETVVGGKIKF